MTFEELLNQLAEDYLNPPSFPDGKKDADRNGHTRLAELQTRYSLSSLKIQKLLVTAGVFEPVKTSSAFYTVKRLFDAGRSVDEIRSATGLSKAAVNAFLPYERGAKELDKLGVDISGDAARKRKQRSAEEMKKENARNILAENMSDEALWNALDEHYRETFITSSGQRFGINLSITEDGDGDKPELTVSVLNRGMIHIPQAEVFNAYHKALEEKALNGDGEDTGKYDEYLRPVFVYLGVLDGDRSEVTTKRDVRESDVCSCCGRIGAPLYSVSSFADLITLDDYFREANRATWTEEQWREAELIEMTLTSEREKYNQKIEAAKDSKVVKAFNEEGERQLCQFCAETIYHALVDGDAPYVGSKTDYRDFQVEWAKKLYKDQLVSTGERWTDDGDIFKAVDTTGTEHFFTLSYREIGPLLSFDAQEVHRLTKAGKRAVNNTDTDYEYHTLIELAAGDDKEQRLYTGLLELMDKVSIGLKSPTLERGQLRTTGTMIPVYVDEGEYGFKIDGKVYSGDEVARMASGTEGWQMQFQIKDPTDDILRKNEYLMPVRLGKKELVDDTLELLRLFTENGEFISDHDADNFSHLFKNVLKKLKLYNDSNPRGFGKLAGMGIIKALGWYEGTEWHQEQVREIIR